MQFDRVTYLYTIVIALTVTTAVASDQALQQDIATISNSPSVYFTPSASVHSLSSELVGPGDDVTSDKKTGTELLAACSAIGQRGTAARDAAQVLLARYPRAIHVQVLPNLYYSASGGTFEDWLMTKTMNARNRFELSPPFMSYETISPCTDFIKASQEHDLQDPTYVGGRLKTAQVTVRITFVYYAGACALSKITGLNLGTDRSRWQEWLGSQNRATSYRVSSSPATGNSSAQSGYETSSRSSSAQPSHRSASGTSYTMPSSGTYTFESLRQQSPLGRKLEIRLNGGSVFVGNLVSVGYDSLRIHVKGATIVPISREYISSITTASR
jgi:hypothetical protein